MIQVEAASRAAHTSSNAHSLPPVEADTKTTDHGQRTTNHRAFTLVELLVVLFIIFVLLALMIQATRGSREAARRNSCLNNFKQLAIAIQHHHDVRKYLPLASTAPLIQSDGVQQYGAIGTASPSADSPANWNAGQSGDGYSWIVQCLPFMEENVAYDKLVENVGTIRVGKLHDAAFATGASAPTQNPGSPPSPTNPYIWSTKIPVFVCPSFPGEEDVAPFFTPAPTIATARVGTGNYVALAATHYRSTPHGHLGSGAPAATKTGGKDCNSGPLCGNGGLPFPGYVNGRVQSSGLRFRDICAGTSRIALLTESREETLTSWYSALASYVVAAMPEPNGNPLQVATAENGSFMWCCGGVPNCGTAINRGSTRGTTTDYYQPVSLHGSGPRIWGPSSRHPGVVLHAFADSHTEAISENIDADVYFAMSNAQGEFATP
jgi:type II secretory pathway pseudopilin PulG